jgi:uncharacterized protein involved in exopolysaccharide biosynthesis
MEESRRYNDPQGGHSNYPLVNHPYPALRTEVQTIHLGEVIRRLFVHRKLIAIWVLCFLVGSVFILVTSRREYSAEAVLLPEKIGSSGAGALGMLEQFGGLLGDIDIGNLTTGQENSLTTDLYPDILQTTPVQNAILDRLIKVPGLDDRVALRSYLDQHLPFSIWDLPGRALSALAGTTGNAAPSNERLDSSIVTLSISDRVIIDKLDRRLTAEMDKQKGVLVISAEMPQPSVAAQVAQAAVEELTAYVTTYRTQKLTNNLAFLQERHQEARTRFEEASNALARFRDQNRNLFPDLARTEEQRLEAEFNVAFGVYSNLSSQAEQARIQLQEETPVFQTLQPVTVPIQKSSPRTIPVILSGLVLGFLSAVAYVLVLPKASRFTSSLQGVKAMRSKSPVST